MWWNLRTVLEGQPMLRVALPPSCLAEKVQSGNDYAQSQPRVNQERLKKSVLLETSTISTKTGFS